MKTYPNQKSIIINKGRVDSDRFTMFSQLTQQKAMVNLDGGALKLWMYLMRNNNAWVIALSQADCAAWGIKKDAYHSGVKKLIELGYLRKRDKNVYDFFEDPQEAPASEEEKDDLDIEDLASILGAGYPYSNVRENRRA